MPNVHEAAKLTVSTDTGISRSVSNYLGVLEVSGPGMTTTPQLHDHLFILDNSHSNVPQLSLGATDNSGIFQLGLDTNGNSILEATHNGTSKNILIQQHTDGFVGIGTNQPASKLHVSSTDAITIPVGTTAQRPGIGNLTAVQGMVRYNTTTSQFEGYGPGGTWGSLGGVINVAQNTKITVAEPDADSSNNEIKFYTAPTGDISANSATLRMIVNDEGNVGIGNSTPQAKLDVGGTMSVGFIGDFENIYTFSEENKILPIDPGNSDEFGASVAISGKYAIVGAYRDDIDNSNLDSGSAYIFDVTTGTQLHKLVAYDASANTHFGCSVAISGNYAIVGRKYDDPTGSLSQSGSAYIFDVTTGVQLHKLTAGSDAGQAHQFGYSVGIDGNYAIVGEIYGDDDNIVQGNSTGAAYIFNVTTGARVHKLNASDSTGSDEFGTSVAISGNYAIVGSPYDDDNGATSGSAYIYNVTTGAELRKLTADDGVMNDYFGLSVAISGNYAIVGAHANDDNGNGSGSAYIFNVQAGVELHKLLPEDGAASDQFGKSVAISGNYAIVGAIYDDDNGDGSGSAYIFNVQTGTQLHKLVASDGAAANYLGKSVAISGTYAIVGAYGDDSGANDGGSAYIFGPPVSRIIGGQKVDGNMFIENGNVGIGTTTPGAPLEIYKKGHNSDEKGGAIILSRYLHGVDGVNNTSTPYRGSCIWHEYTSGNDCMMFASSSNANPYTLSPSMVLTNQGNVGIGTTTPGSILEVYDNSAAGEVKDILHVKNSGGYDMVSLGTSSNFNSGAISLYQNSTTKATPGIVINSNGNTYFNGGNVGIGATSPSARLQINSISSSTNNPEILTLKNAYNTNNSSNIVFRDYTNIVGQIGTLYDGTKMNFTFSHLYNSGYRTGEIMRICGNGHVGIGTTDPGNFKLKIYNGTGINLTGSNSWHNQFCVEDQNTTGTGITFKAGTHTGYIYYGSSNGSPWAGNGSFGFATTATGAQSDIKMVIKNDGNVGIGIADPTAPLHIKTTAVGDLIRFEGSGYYRAAIGFGTNFSDYPAGELSTHPLPGGQPTQGGLILQCRASDNEGAALWMNGMSAGIISPGDNHTWSWKDEDGYVNNALNYSWHITKAGALVNNSDIRLKENIRYFDDEYEISEIKEKYAQIKFCKYNWIKPLKDPSGVKTDNYGIIAQELEIKFPEMIEFDGHTDTRMLNQERIKYISYYVIQDLVKENQELKTEVAELKTKNAALETKVTDQVSRIDRIDHCLTDVSNNSVIINSMKETISRLTKTTNNLSLKVINMERQMIDLQNAILKLQGE